jgi:hypothetical protein
MLKGELGLGFGAMIIVILVALIWLVPLLVCLLAAVCSWISPRFRRFCTEQLFGMEYDPSAVAYPFRISGRCDGPTVRPPLLPRGTGAATVTLKCANYPAAFNRPCSSFARKPSGANTPPPSVGKVAMRVNVEMTLRGREGHPRHFHIGALPETTRMPASGSV